MMNEGANKPVGDRQFHELSEELQKMIIDENGQTLRGLNASINDWASKALKFLVLINTGGALIIVTQTGALISKAETIEPLYFPAAAFILGIIISGILNFYIWHKSVLRLRAISKQNHKFFRNKAITLAEYANSDDMPSLRGWAVRAMGIASALMFVIGVVLGFWALDTLKFSGLG